MRLSIIIVTFNCREALRMTLNSVFGQRADPDSFELLVVDGASMDGTLEVIKEHASRLRWISEKDNGIYDAMNKGIRLARGDYLQFLNAGDLFFDETVLEEVLPLLDGKNDVVFGDIEVVDEDYKKVFDVRYSTRFCLDALKARGTAICNHQAFFVKKSVAPFYSDKYKLKGELNWYIDLASTPSLSARHLDKLLITYVLGGKGYICFWRNLFEWICIVQRRFGLLQNIKNIHSYYRFFRYRFYSSKK
ncbi:glycosyltransferase [Desulfovibrio sp. OttesenSCG-928-M14]|nr:glycosyltransferase [Desulfovibrio sp. OttesenSCG-928-M14]